MATKKKMLQAAAGAGGEVLDITDVFSTYLYTGNSSTQTINNGIDLDGEGGLVWLKTRSSTTTHALFDTERGASNKLSSDTTGAASTSFTGVSAFNSDGFSLGSIYNTSPVNYASWTFRKAPKFFDVVTYTGDGNSATIPHNLGCTPGMIIVKKTSGVSNWLVWHKDKPSNNGELNTTNAVNFASYINSPTPTGFNVWGVETHEAGATYVAYLFAHNDGDGGFGPSGDQDIIKCGSFTATLKTASVDLGFEPQWILTKCSSTANAEGWEIFDNMRGMPVNRSDNRLFANSSIAEETGENSINVRADGFDIEDNIVSGGTYIYMAIRRGPLAPPESGTEVFNTTLDTTNALTTYDIGFPVDMMISSYTGVVTTGNRVINSRLQGFGYVGTDTVRSLFTYGNDSEQTLKTALSWDNNTGFTIPEEYKSGSESVHWSWKRAPGFFDVVAYTGDGTAGRTISHNLGVAPEMMWVKKRSGVESWAVYHSLNGGTHFARLQGTDAYVANSNVWGNTDTTASVFTVDTDTEVNQSGQTYIAYLFASLPGVSKVFSVTKSSGSDASVDCGFTSGPRFVMLKRTDSTGDWYVWDTERGIVAGNDPYLLLNSTAAEVTSTDYIDPTSNGFTIVNGGLADGDYIGYAVS